jgi:hypothetical protein
MARKPLDLRTVGDARLAGYMVEVECGPVPRALVDAPVQPDETKGRYRRLSLAETLAGLLLQDLPLPRGCDNLLYRTDAGGTLG